MSPVALISSGGLPISPRCLSRAQAGQQSEVPVAQVGPAVSHSALALEHTIGIEEAIGVDEIIRAGLAMDFGQHRQLERVVVEAVEQLEPDPDRSVAGVAERIRSGTRRSHSRTMAPLARADRNPPESARNPSPAASATAPRAVGRRSSSARVVSPYSDSRQVDSPGAGRWYLTDGTTSRLRSRPIALAAPHQFEVIVERLPPASAFPGDGPALRAGRRAGDRLGDHLRFLDRPGRHRLRVPAASWAITVLRTTNPRSARRRPPRPAPVQRELARRLAPGIPDRHARRTSRHVQPVSLQEITIQVLGQALAGEAFVVRSDPGGAVRACTSGFGRK